MRHIFLITTLLLSVSAFGQEEIPENLQERFNYMKEKSQTYNDYKVIKGTVLDGVWKITMDSVKAQRVAIREANATIQKLNGDLATVNATIAEKDTALAEMEHDGTHINVIGIDIHKYTFISITGFVFLGLLVLAGLLFIRLKFISTSIREKTEAVDLLSNEFEEYKRNALDKQMKLSRELQDERNKLQELGHA